MKNIKSARLLVKAARDLEASLQKTYEPHPVNPETDFLNAAADVAFFSRIVFNDLVKRQGPNISTSWALRTAIAIGDFDKANRFLDVEIIDMKSENLDLAQLREIIELGIRHHGRSERWKQLLSRIDEAM